MKKKLFGIFASIFTLFALFTSVSACFVLYYQPKEPKCLNEK
jgi:cyclic lactone autoinducer peptide